MRRIARVPTWTQTVRFRLAVLYSLLLLAGMIVVVAAIYTAFAATADSSPVADEVRKTGYLVKPNGKVIALTDTTDLTDFESAVNDKTLSTLRTYSIISLAALPVLSIGLGWVLAGRALRPVQRIATVAGEIEAQDLSRRINLTGPRDELRDLADTFDRMLERLDAAFASQRQFLDEASHDLRNPLATMRTNLDVVLRNPDATVHDFRDASKIAVRAVDRMSGIVDSLLAVARQQNAAAELGEVDLTRLVQEVVDEHRASAAERSLVIATTIDGPSQVAGDGPALRRAIANLLENAVRLAPAASIVRVGAGTQSGWRWIGVSDEGPGIPPAQRERIFDRAWTTGAPGHRGLGLAIVSQTALSHGGVAKVMAVGPGSMFLIWLPGRRTSSGEKPPTGDPLSRHATR